MATTASPSNTAAWALKAKSRPFVVSSAPYRAPPPGHVAIKVHCVAINPIDWIMQDQDIFGAHYPAIFGSDLAGEVVQTGQGVMGLSVGQKVIAYVLTSSPMPCFGCLASNLHRVSIPSTNRLTNTTTPATPTASQPTTPPTALSNNTSSRPQSPSRQFPPPPPSKAPSSSPSQSPPQPQASTNATTSPFPTPPTTPPLCTAPS